VLGNNLGTKTLRRDLGANHLDMVRINHGSESIPGVQLQTTAFIY
jgi:hypothetical protein